MAKKDSKFSEETIKKKRSFPIANTVWLVIIFIVQITIILLAANHEPQPQDIIKEYHVTVDPLADGSLDIEYSFVWHTVDTSQKLTWVEIGMANEHFTVYPSSVSDTTRSFHREEYGDYVGLRLDFVRAYSGGETLRFSFKINQKNMLCQDDRGYFYEFVPGWFNGTPVEHYEFRWRADENSTPLPNATYDGAYYLWQGRLECGGYEKMYVSYPEDAFTGCKTVQYQPFDDSGTGNDLLGEKNALIFLACFFALLLIIAQVYIVDSYVSYSRGRGFLTGYGHHVHVYGRTNPQYEKTRDRRLAAARRSGGSGGRSGGCACACACACAGGGRAGCSQKDTFGNSSAAESDRGDT